MSPADHALFLGTSYDDTLRVHRLATQLEDVIAASTTGLAGRFRPTNLALALRAFVDSISNAAKERGLHLAFDADEEMEDVYVDHGMLARAFVALIANAFEHVKRNGAITVTVRDQMSGVDVAIADTGPGMTNDEAQEIGGLDLGRAIAKGRERRHLGLGLWLTQRYLEAHGGSVDIEGRPFVVTLRFIKGREHLERDRIEEHERVIEGLAPADLVELEGDRRASSRGAAGEGEHAASRGTLPPAEAGILVVAGTETARESLAQLLRGRYAVRATTIGEALGVALEQGPDVVIVDVETSPGEEALYKALRAADTGPLASVQVLRILDRPPAPSKTRVMKPAEGAREQVLVRPFTGALLLAETRNLVRLKDLSESLRARYEALEARSQRISAELVQARDLQQSMLTGPAGDLPGLRVEIAYRPADIVAGELYDFSVLDNTLLRIFIADSMSGGIAASLATMVIKAEYEAIKWTSIRPSPVLSALNERFTKKYGHLNIHFSALLLSIDLHAAVARYSLAAHPAPLKLTGETVMPLSGDPSSDPIGLSPNTTFQEYKVAFEPNDALYAFTDGLVDEKTTAGEAFSVRGLTGAILRARAEGLSEVAAVSRWIVEATAAGRSLDDITFIGLRRY